MKNVSLHHIHVKCGDEFYTIAHDGDCISLSELTHICTQIVAAQCTKFDKKVMK